VFVITGFQNKFSCAFFVDPCCYFTDSH